MRSFYLQFKEEEINNHMLQWKGGGSVNGHIEQDLVGGVDESLRDGKLGKGEEQERIFRKVKSYGTA